MLDSIVAVICLIYFFVTKEPIILVASAIFSLSSNIAYCFDFNRYKISVKSKIINKGDNNV